MAIAVTLKAARIIRDRENAGDPDQNIIALHFPPVHALFRFESKIYRAEWDGKLWEGGMDSQGQQWPRDYAVSVLSGGYGRNGTYIGGTHVKNGIVEVPNHMIWDSRIAYLSEEENLPNVEYNLRWCEMANLAILLKAGQAHVLNGGLRAPEGMERLTPPGLPKPGEYFRWAFDAGQQLLLENANLAPEEVQRYLQAVPFIPENLEGFTNGFVAGYYVGLPIPEFEFSCDWY